MLTANLKGMKEKAGEWGSVGSGQGHDQMHRPQTADKCPVSAPYTDSSIHLYVPIRVPSRFPRWPFLTSIFPHVTNSFPRTLDNLTPYFTEKTCNIYSLSKLTKQSLECPEERKFKTTWQNPPVTP